MAGARAGEIADCRGIITTVYDPSDGTGDVPTASLPPWPDASSLVGELNQALAALDNATLYLSQDGKRCAARADGLWRRQPRQRPIPTPALQSRRPQWQRSLLLAITIKQCLGMPPLAHVGRSLLVAVGDRLGLLLLGYLRKHGDDVPTRGSQRVHVAVASSLQVRPVRRRSAVVASGLGHRHSGRDQPRVAELPTSRRRSSRAPFR
jgi:hypothetical protein